MQKKNKGFTLIELLVVVAIIGLLSSIALLAFADAREKSRDAKRLGDMTQLNTGLALYFGTNKGYPSGTLGVPVPLVPNFTASLPSGPTPADGGCAAVTSYPSPVPLDSGNIGGAGYYYYPSGTSYLGADGSQVYPDYAYYFCLGNQTGNFAPGLHILTPEGLQ